MNYKELFKKAQDKGYFIRDLQVVDWDERDLNDANNFMRGVRLSTCQHEMNLLQKWLRENYNVHTVIRPGLGDRVWFDGFVVDAGTHNFLQMEEDEAYATYEDAQYRLLELAMDMVK